MAPEEGSAANPFTLVKRFATPEDFVVVKLDIDTPSVEGPLARQLLEDTALQALVASTAALKERQEAPDSAEALRCMPSLALADIPRKPTSIPTSMSSSHGVPVLSHELFTNDVLYAEALLDLRTVPAALLPLVPLFCRALTNM